MDGARAEVLRYLGHKGQDVPGDLNALVDECITLMREAATPRHVMREFAVIPAENGVRVMGTGIILRGRDIARHLSGCGKIILLAATLGVGADNLIRRWERVDLTRSLTLDACAARLIEEVCDGIERQAREDAAAGGFMAARRYSPGYGDLPLELQPEILAALDAGRRIGLTCTESLILLPRKSVTAIIGLGKNLGESPYGCGGCALRSTCRLRKDGNNNGCPGMDKG